MCNELPDDFALAEFRAEVINWFHEYGRSFPWRDRRETYPVLVAECLLHRTRADKVAELYDGFLQRWSNPSELASAPRGEVEKHLYPLGLNWRATHLHKLAQEVMDRFNGRIPTNQKELESLPGIGHYIASAVRCFALGMPEAIVDTNTVRILGRVFELEVTDYSRRSKRFHRLMSALVDPESPREFNFGLLDIGAGLCVPSKPQCQQCPLLRFCTYGNRRLRKGH